MLLGSLTVLLGIVAFFASVSTSLVTVLFLGILLLAIGIMEIVGAFRRRHEHPFIAYFLAGALTIVVGALFLYRPLSSLASLTLVIAAYLFASGLFRGISAISERYPRWGWDVAYAVVALALGAYVVAYWPLTSLWVLGTVVAAEVTMRGVSLMAAASVLRDLQHHRLPHAYASA